FRAEALAQLLELSDVGFILLRHMWNRAPRFPHVLGRLPAYSAHGNTFDLSPLAEIRKRRLSYVGCGRSARTAHGTGNNALSESLNIGFTDATTGPAPGHVVNVDSKFASQSADMRRCRNWAPMFNSRRAVEVQRHCERCHCLTTRLIGRQRLLFSFAFGLQRGLKCCTGMIVRFFWLRRLLGVCSRSCSGFEREDDLSNFDLFPLSDENIFHGAAD